MRKMRDDNPETNPLLRIDALPTKGRKVTVSNDPRPAAKRKADTKPAPAPAPKRTVMDDARDRTAAKRDEAIAQMRVQHKTSRRGFNREDMQGPSKATPAPTMDASAARDAAHASIKAAARKGAK